MNSRGILTPALSALVFSLAVSSSTKFRMRQRSAAHLWRHERGRSPRGGPKIDLAILQAVAGHRQVLPTHHTARKIISEPKKSHSRSGLVKELTN